MGINGAEKPFSGAQKKMSGVAQTTCEPENSNPVKSRFATVPALPNVVNRSNARDKLQQLKE